MSHRFGGVSEHSKVAQHRLDDAWALFQKKRWRGAMYLGGYSVECLLKTHLMQRHGCNNLRELEEYLRDHKLIAAAATIYTHQLEMLLRLVGGVERLRKNVQLWQQFNIINSWIPAWRYNPDLSNPNDAGDFLRAAEAVRDWVKNNT